MGEGEGDLARISRDTRLLRCMFRNTRGKKHHCLFSRSFFSLPLCGRVFMNRCRKLLETRFLHEARSNTSAAIDKSVRDGRGRKKKNRFAKRRIIIIINMGEIIVEFIRQRRK